MREWITRASALAGRVTHAWPLMRKKPQPRGNVRNFYLHGYCGNSEENGTVSTMKLLSNGPWGKMGGFDLEVYQRVNALAAGGMHVLHLEGRADVFGRLRLRVYAVQKNNTVIYDGESWRDGVAMDDGKKAGE